MVFNPFAWMTRGASPRIERIWMGTKYNMLLAAGLDRVLARQQVADQVQAILGAWRK
jgi:hypothetical protein